MLEKFYHINEAAGVSILISREANGGAEVNACGVAIDNNRLNIGKKVTCLTTLRELTGHFPAKTVITFNLWGKGILHKQVEKIDEVTQDNFSKILPNANFDDFYIQNFISGDQSFVSVVRKAEADKWIVQLKELGFIPLMLSLGPFPVQNMAAQINFYDAEIIFDGHTIRRNERSEWTAYNYNAIALSKFPVKIESEIIDEKLLVPYAAAFQLVLADKVESIQALVPALESAFREQVEEKKLKVYGFVMLTVFFVMLLINFFLFSSLNSDNARLTEQLSSAAHSTDDLHKLNEQVQQKDSLLKALGWEGAISKSALVDQLAALLPPEITLKEAAVDPVDLASSRVQKAIIFFNRRIQVSGISERIIPVNEWIARIKTKSWVKNVQLDSYIYNNELNTGQFTIVISY